MGWNIGGHAYGYSTRAINQKVGELGGKNRGLLHRVIVVGLEIHRVLVDVFQQRMGGQSETGFGITHGCRTVAIHGSEIALPFQQRQAHGKNLGHAHHGVVDGLVAVGMVLTHDVADHAGRLAERLVMVVSTLFHGVKNAAVDRFQTVSCIGQRP